MTQHQLPDRTNPAPETDKAIPSPDVPAADTPPVGEDIPARRHRAEPGGAKQPPGTGHKGGQPHKASVVSGLVIQQAAKPAHIRPRHWGVLFGFLLLVAGPVAAVYTYLWYYAVDQYSSTVGFSVRTEESESSLDVLGALAGTSQSNYKDTDILYEFIQSQALVSALDEILDLREIWSWPRRTENGTIPAPSFAVGRMREWLASDPIFTYHPGGTIEDMMSYWGRMVRIDYDASTGLMQINVRAFRPEDAKSVAAGIFQESSRMINDLSSIARSDSTQYARDELELSEKRLRAARLAVTEFRERTQVVDPQAVIQGQDGLINKLQAQLAETLVELDLLREISRDADPRVSQAMRKVEVIRERIAEEREKFNARGIAGKGFSAIVSEYEKLTIEREFAEQAYLAALSAYNSTLAEARRQNRYLAPYIQPSQAERSEHPKRFTILGLFALFNFLLCMIGTLIYYAIRDRH